MNTTVPLIPLIMPYQHDESCDGRGVFTNRHNCERCAALVKRLNDRIASVK